MRLKGRFRWGAPLPPPDGYFNWNGEETEREETTSPPETMDTEGPELPLPGFQWRDEPRTSEGAEFNWAEDGGPPAIPFQFAHEDEEAEQPSPERTPPPPIPFRFADDAEPPPGSEDDAQPPPPRGILPKLGFRWRGKTQR